MLALINIPPLYIYIPDSNMPVTNEKITTAETNRDLCHIDVQIREKLYGRVVSYATCDPFDGPF